MGGSNLHSRRSFAWLILPLGVLTGLVTTGFLVRSHFGSFAEGPFEGWSILAAAIVIPTTLWIWREDQLRRNELLTRESYRETVYALASAVDAGDPFMRGRPYRTARFCLAVGRRMGMKGRALQDLEFAGLLHDIGRTAIHNDILHKPASLSEVERRQLQTHPQIGYHILRRIPLLEGAAELVYAHHEQPNGKGYPRGLMADQIPLGAKIIMCIAAFDAMTSDRPYRSGLDTSEAYHELRSSIGTMFEREVVETLIELHKSGEIFEEIDPEQLAIYAPGSSGNRSLRGIERHLSTERYGTLSVNGSAGREPNVDGTSGAEEGTPRLYEIDLEPELAEQIDAALEFTFRDDDSDGTSRDQAA